MNKKALKQLLARLPYLAEVDWYLRKRGKPARRRFTLDRLQKQLPQWKAEIEPWAEEPPSGKRVLIFAARHTWIAHGAALGMALAGMGQWVTLAYTPYSRWAKPINRYDLRQQNVYAQNVLGKLSPFVQAISWLNLNSSPQNLPPALAEAIREVSLRDTQYTLQVEEVSAESALYRLRLERNRAIAQSALDWMQANPPDVVIIPNGTIMDLGAVYRVARYLDLPTVTYEFGEQRERIWLAQNAEVMRQQTDALWAARGGRGLTTEQLERVKALFAARQRAGLWENFARRWQGAPSSGGEQARLALSLDSRPIILLATNVIGDSLTLGRQVFSESMTEWLERTVRYVASRPDVQLVIRIHPGELIAKGPSVADVVKRTLSEIPPHIFLVPADSKINTYDLVEIADLGLVYTTTVGLEIAMSGAPVIAVGNTHYRGKGFTLDAESWEAYFQLLADVLSQPGQFRLSPEQVACAWEYAYRFFFEYPRPFPWHLSRLWNDLQEWPLKRVLSAEGQAQFGETFRYLSGEPIRW